VFARAQASCAWTRPAHGHLRSASQRRSAFRLGNVSAVGAADHANVSAGYILAADAKLNHSEAAHSDVGKK
jgi:hypothetical protein